jgi:arylsulfatase A-like enzyme
VKLRIPTRALGAARVLAGTFATVALLIVAHRYGGAEDPHQRVAAPPSGGAAPDGGAPAKNEDSAEEEALDLVGALGDARLDVPSLARGTMLFSAHWRRMAVPFLELPPDRAKLATSVALRTSDDVKQWSVPTASGGAWTPDARVWNMSEGSFDQREAIFAPTPAKLSFHVRVPAHASLHFAPGTANYAGDDTIFAVTVKDARGNPVPVWDKRYLAEETRGWADEVTVDLERWSGQEIELTLATTAVPRAAPPPKSAPRRKPVDGGAPGASEDALGATGLTLALWGNPVLRSRRPPKLPYNVLFVVVDALRPDAIAAFHDPAVDAKKASAAHPPLEAMVPKIDGLVPNLDALAARGVRFTQAYSGGSWTRPGTLSMLSGMRSSELGVETLPWVLPDAETTHYYASDPPLLALLLRRAGAVTRAFVNNYFMVGYAPVGVDMGFARVDDHRYRTKDTALVTENAIAWLKANAKSRFFMFCNYNSPHEPWEPPPQFLPRVPAAPLGPKDDVIRRYLAEAAKDDEAIGLLLRTLDELGLRENTLVIVTADHGETFSSAHAGVSALDKMQVRFHHAVSNFEETTHVPILMALPKVLPENVDVTARVRNTDIAPTILELMGIEKNGKMTGASLLPLVRGEKEPDERVIVSEGRGTRAIISGKYRAIFREGKAQTWTVGDKQINVAEELYDLDADPGERHNLARTLPDVVAEMRARLDAAKANVPMAGTAASLKTAGDEPAPRIRLRFVGRGATHRVNGTLTATAAGKPATLRFDPVALAKDAFRLDGGKLELALVTVPDQPVGVDLVVTPPDAALAWQLWLDDAPWPMRAVYTGPFGLYDPAAGLGLMDDAARSAAAADDLPTIDPARDLGLFVVRDPGRGSGPERGTTAAGKDEMERLLKEWGYAHGSK